MATGQLNTHNIASPYEAFAPAGTRPLAGKQEIHHTPRHERRLNIAEIERGVLSRRYIDRCLESPDQLAATLAPRERSRNDKEAVIDWRFTTADA